MSHPGDSGGAEKNRVPGESKWLTPFAKTKAREHGTFLLQGDLDGQKMASPPRRTSNMSVDVKYIGMDVHKEAIAIMVMNEWERGDGAHHRNEGDHHSVVYARTTRKLVCDL
jgi:hypothetical protein